MEQYPYFIYPDIKRLRKGNLSREEEIRLRRKIAANIGDPRVLRVILGDDPEDFANFYPPHAKPVTGTLETIDSFLNKFGSSELPLSEATAAIAEPVTETTSELPAEQPSEVTEEDGIAAIKNKDYKTALEIFKRLNLNNPKKSIYFADQMRFLKKLIYNETHKSL